MWGYEIGFDRPEFLLLGLLLIPPLWFLSYRSLSGLGTFRRLSALIIRTCILALFICALAEVQWKDISDRVTVIYLLDQSESIPLAKRQLMFEYVAREVDKHRKADDWAGVVIFGREAVVEVPAFADNLPVQSSAEAYLEHRDATNLEDALKLAQSLFADDTSRRIVLVTDGNENLGNARKIAPVLARNGIGIDAVVVKLSTRAEVAVERISLPQDIRRGQVVDMRVVLNNFMEGDDPTARVTGKLTVIRAVGNKEEPVGEEIPVELPPGKTVVRLQHTIDSPAMYTYKARFVPDDSQDDAMAQNNVATTFTHVRGKGRVLLIEDVSQPGNFDYLIDRLRAMNLEIDVRDTGNMYSSLAELQGYDAVILANVPRSSGEDANTVVSFSDDQISMLVRNTEQMGAGLIMLGGENSFGVGGWSNTELEKAMPVDFQIKNSKIQAVGALVLMMHASEMAQGNFWQKVVAREAIKALGPMDYCGLVHWDNAGRDSWLWNPGLAKVGDKKTLMLRLLNSMTPGDMPDFEPSMKLALAQFNQCPASMKHMIVISDGDPTPPNAATVLAFQQAGVKISTVAVGTHGAAGHRTLQNIANATQGNYYVVNNPKALPKIFQREARRVTRPLIKDLNNVPPNRDIRHPILEGIEGGLPPLKGMVLTTVKPNTLVEVALRSPDPPDEENNTVLAAWQYNNGRVVAFTTDAGHQWANAWTSWENYDKFFSQMVRWAMRPVEDDDQFMVATDVRDGKVRVVITALDAQEDFKNFLNLTGSAVAPNLQTFDFNIVQEAPGRYVGEFDAPQSGSYHITVGGREGKPPILAGANVPYSAEFRDREENLALLRELVSLQPDGGNVGQLASDDLSRQNLPRLLETDTFRQDLPKAKTVFDVWPLFLLIAGVLFFADVFVRRVAIGYDMIAPAVQRFTALFRRQDSSEVSESLERLRSSKEAVASELDQRRAATRFEPARDQDVEELDEALGPAASAPAANRPLTAARPSMSDAGEEENYTSRLLQAKKKAWNENKS